MFRRDGVRRIGLGIHHGDPIPGRMRGAADVGADAGEVEEVLADWWQEFSLADDNLRQDMVDQVREEQQQKQRSPRVHKKPLPGAAPAQAAEVSPPADGELVGMTRDAIFSSEAPKKRRRRRRAAGGPGEGGADAPEAGV